MIGDPHGMTVTSYRSMFFHQYIRRDVREPASLVDSMDPDMIRGSAEHVILRQVSAALSVSCVTHSCHVLTSCVTRHCHGPTTSAHIIQPGL